MVIATTMHSLIPSLFWLRAYLLIVLSNLQELVGDTSAHRDICVTSKHRLPSPSLLPPHGEPPSLTPCWCILLHSHKLAPATAPDFVDHVAGESRAAPAALATETGYACGPDRTSGPPGLSPMASG
jgi:hypothetical protein